jgi:hypothetical protein
LKQSNLFSFALSVALACAHANAQQLDPERQAILETANGLFAALANRDRDAMLRRVVEVGRVTSVARDPNRPAFQSMAWADYMTALAEDSTRYEERLLSHEIAVDDDIAVLWGEYGFYIDGELVHCGTDHFDFVRIDDRWRVLNLTWSERSSDCE